MARRNRRNDPDWMVELQRLPRGVTHKQLAAFAEYMEEMYRQKGRATNQHVPFGKACGRRIRMNSDEDFATAMRWAVNDVGHVEALLMAKKLILG